MYKLKINRFWTLVISVTVVVALSFSVEAVLSQALPDELRPEQGAEGPVGSIGVPVEINGVVKELQVGDVITTGTVTEVDKEDLLIKILDSLQTAGVVETSTILGAVGHVLSLPNEVCDFDDISVGSSVATNRITNETKTETIKLSVAPGCKLKFEGKSSDFGDAAEQEDETSQGSSSGLGDTSWLIPTPIQADSVKINPRDNRLENDNACKALKDGKVSSTKYPNGNQAKYKSKSGDGERQFDSANTSRRSGLGSGLPYLKVATIGLVRLEDKAITVRIDGNNNITNNILDEDCGVFFAETKVTYNKNGSNTVRDVESICSSWENHDRFELPFDRSLAQPFAGGIKDTYIWLAKRCSSSKFNLNRGANTRGFFAINYEKNLFLNSLEEAGYSRDSDLFDDLDGEEYELNVRNSVTSRGTRVNYSCRIDQLPSFDIDRSQFETRERELKEPDRIKIINGKTYVQIGGGDTIASIGKFLIPAEAIGAYKGHQIAGNLGALIGAGVGAFVGKDVDFYQTDNFPEVFQALKAGELYVQIPDSGPIDTYMECNSAFSKVINFPWPIPNLEESTTSPINPSSN